MSKSRLFFSANQTNSQLTILLLGDYNTHKHQALECLASTKLAPRVVIMYDCHNAAIKLADSSKPLNVLLIDTPDQDRFRPLLAKNFHFPDIVLACITKKNEFDDYQVMAAKSNKPEVPLVYIIRENQENLLADAPANTVVFKANDTSESFFASIAQKVKEMAEYQPSPPRLDI